LKVHTGQSAEAHESTANALRLRPADPGKEGVCDILKDPKETKATEHILRARGLVCGIIASAAIWAGVAVFLRM
jgi:hypothetical protein